MLFLIFCLTLPNHSSRNFWKQMWSDKERPRRQEIHYLLLHVRLPTKPSCSSWLHQDPWTRRGNLQCVRISSNLSRVLFTFAVKICIAWWILQMDRALQRRQGIFTTLGGHIVYNSIIKGTENRRAWPAILDSESRRLGTCPWFHTKVGLLYCKLLSLTPWQPGAANQARIKKTSQYTTHNRVSLNARGSVEGWLFVFCLVGWGWKGLEGHTRINK